MRTSRSMISARAYGYAAMSADVASANAANTLADATGLSFNVFSGQTYHFEFFVFYDAAATTTGSRWVINGPNVTWLRYFSRYTLTGTSITDNQGLTAYNLPAASSASSLTTGNIAIIRGSVLPSADGTIQLKFASEVVNSAITAKAGSFVTYEVY